MKLRVFAVVLAAGLAGVLGTGPLRAERGQQASYSVVQTPVAVPLRAPSTDAAGTLPVSVHAGQPTKMSVIDLGEVAPGAKATLSLDAAGSVMPETAQVQGCLVTGPWQPADSGPWDARPSYDCETSGDLTLDGSEATLDLTELAASWADGTANLGVALVAQTPIAAGATWQITFRGFPLGGISLTSGASETVPDAEPLPTFESEDAPVGADAPEGLFDLGAAPLPAVPAPPVAAVPPVSAGAGPDLVPRVLAAVAFDRARELVAGVAALLVAAAVAGVTRHRYRQLATARHLAVAAGATVLALSMVALTWAGVARQPVTWAQVPYLASSGLAAVIFTLIGCTFFVASAAGTLPAHHVLRRLASQSSASA